MTFPVSNPLPPPQTCRLHFQITRPVCIVMEVSDIAYGLHYVAYAAADRSEMSGGS